MHSQREHLTRALAMTETLMGVLRRVRDIAIERGSDETLGILDEAVRGVDPTCGYSARDYLRALAHEGRQ